MSTPSSHPMANACLSASWLLRSQADGGHLACGSFDTQRLSTGIHPGLSTSGAAQVTTLFRRRPVAVSGSVSHTPRHSKFSYNETATAPPPPRSRRRLGSPWTAGCTRRLVVTNTTREVGMEFGCDPLRLCPSIARPLSCTAVERLRTELRDRVLQNQDRAAAACPDAGPAAALGPTPFCGR
jgi:hypothetical protein